MSLFSLFKRSEPPSASVAAARARAQTPATAPSVTPAVPAEPPPPPRVRGPVPPELAAYRPVKAGQLDAARREVLIKLFQTIPRPPRLMDKLLSPDFVSKASSSELADLIVAEPVLAAKLLGTINSPMYGLRNPVASVEQAVTLLGLTAVRSLCLQYLMAHSFKADSAARQQILDTIWQSSGLASEITQRLASAMGLPDQASLVSQVVLTFLGRLGTVATMPRGLLDKIPARDMLARADAEQAVLGVSATEVGRLLMAHWGLPDVVIHDACEVESVLYTPYANMEPAKACRLGLCYLAARLGERLANDPTLRPETIDITQDNETELYQFLGYLEHPALAGVQRHWTSPPMIQAIHRLRRAAQGSEAP
ncbi:MAG: HDOD domain-containing protein [Rubrivivax sp.]|nr:HDOD domain-containing protein [Rubrivivax sp.]